MATKSYGDRPRSSYLDMVAAEERRIEEYTRRANRESDRRRMFAGEYESIMPGLTDEDAAKTQRGAAQATYEIPTMMATSVLADVPAGYAGMSAPTGQRVNAIESAQEKFTFMPRGETSKSIMNWLGETMQDVGNKLVPIREGYEGVMNPAVGPAIAAIPWVVAGTALETVPGPQKGATTAARATERAAGQFVRAAELAGDELHNVAATALKHDPTAGARATVLRDNPDADMSRVAQDVQGEQNWNEAIPENDVPYNAPDTKFRTDFEDVEDLENHFSYLMEERDNLEMSYNQLDPSDPDYRGTQARLIEEMKGMDAAIDDISNLRDRAESGQLVLGQTRAGRGQRGSIEDTGGGQRVIAAQAGRNLATNTAEILRDQPSPQDLPPVNVETPGAKVGTMDRRVGTTGKYRGAPREIDSPQKLGNMRKDLLASLERGAPGRQWYDRSSEAALSLTGDRPNLRDRYVGSIAVTSADTAVPSNAGFAIKGFNQLNAGDPVHTGRYPQRMSKDIEKIASGEEKMLSDKVGPFYEANKITDLGKDVRPTNDLWMARAFGYTQKDPKTGKFVEWSSGLGEAQHRFMDEEINRLVDIANERKLGGHDDWTPERVQAAIWVDTKARRENTSIERAATDFATDLDSRSINITSETRPAESLDHMPGVYDNEARGQLAFEQQNRIMTDDQGRNILATGANALTRPQTTGVGVYEGASNPVAVNRILGSTETGVPTMDPSSRKIAETVASTEGMLKGQESVGYNFLRKPQRVGDANAAVVPQVDDVKALQGQLDEAFGGDVIATPSEEGIRILKVDGAPFDAKQRKALQGIVGEKPDWKINSGDLVGGSGEYKPSNYLNTIDDTVAGNMDVNTRWAAGALEKLDDVLVKEFPDAGARSDILQRTRQAIAEGGIAKVRELVQQGVLPAVVIGVLVGGQAGSPESQRQQT